MNSANLAAVPLQTFLIPASLVGWMSKAVQARRAKCGVKSWQSWVGFGQVSVFLLAYEVVLMSVMPKIPKM